MLRFIFTALAFFFLFRFITGLLIPLVRTTLQLRRGLRTAKEQMEESIRRQQASATQARPQPKGPPPADTGDYLDFEEIK